jgi:predicted nuclease with TOPRIM domain
VLSRLDDDARVTVPLHLNKMLRRVAEKLAETQVENAAQEVIIEELQARLEDTQSRLEEMQALIAEMQAHVD